MEDGDGSSELQKTLGQEDTSILKPPLKYGSILEDSAPLSLEGSPSDSVKVTNCSVVSDKVNGDYIDEGKIPIKSPNFDELPSDNVSNSLPNDNVNNSEDCAAITGSASLVSGNIVPVETDEYQLSESPSSGCVNRQETNESPLHSGNQSTVLPLDPIEPRVLSSFQSTKSKSPVHIVTEVNYSSLHSDTRAPEASLDSVNESTEPALDEAFESSSKSENNSTESVTDSDTPLNDLPVDSGGQNESGSQMNDVLAHSEIVNSESVLSKQEADKSSLHQNTACVSETVSKTSNSSDTEALKSTSCSKDEDQADGEAFSNLGSDVGANSSANEKNKPENSSSEGGNGEKFPIQYKGFKKKLCSEPSEQVKIDKRICLKSNPFSPVWKKDSKTLKYSNVASKSSEKGNEDDDDASSLQTEYAQYLGLQPIVKFKCSNCGLSGFQSMTALNNHLVGCVKLGKVPTPPSKQRLPSEQKSANIKLTRKVFLCSACGTYYENWNLFLHMREVHRRYICLFCLGMYSVAEKLAEHLTQKHNVSSQHFSAVEDFHNNSYPSFFLLCLTCDNVFSEADNFYTHTCSEETATEVVCLNKATTVGTNESALAICTNVVPPKPPSPENKPPPNKNVNMVQSKKTGKKSSGQKGTSSKSEFEEDFICSAASFCHVDLGDNQNAQHAPPPSDAPVTSEKQKDKEEEKTSTEETSSLKADETPKLVENPVNVEESDNLKKQENVEENEISEVPNSGIPSVESSSEKRRGVKRQRSAPPKKPARKKRMSAVSRMQKILVKIENSLGNEANSERAVDQVLDSQKLENETSVLENQTPSPKIEKIEPRREVDKNIFKLKLQSDLDSDGESDDSQKLSLVVDENASVSDNEVRKMEEDSAPQISNSSNDDEQKQIEANTKDEGICKEAGESIQLASEDVPAMALTLDDKIDNVKIQAVVKECVRTSCLSCNYCRHAVKIAVNGKQLALHLLSEHRYTPVKNETSDDVVRTLRKSLEELNTMFFNTETYDSSDQSIHIPYDKDNNFDCFQCNYVTNSHRDLYAHKRKSHTKSLLLCIMCKSNFYSYSELLCHLCPGSYNAEIQFHNTDISFRCCFCRLDTIPSAFRLMVHLRKCHHTCDICLEICPDQQKLSTHMWKHKLNHLCYRCGIAYASKPDITKHLFWKHGTESVLCKKCLQKKWPHVYHFCIPPTSFICEECNTSFSKAVALKVHKRIHAGDFSYSCTQCEKKFVSKKLLARHEERHKKLLERAEAKSTVKSEDSKEEIINVTDLPNETKEMASNENVDSNKDTDVKDKGHKKHKKDKEKEKKAKVLDVYDLPPLNLSSESDSSEDEGAEKNKTIPMDEGSDGRQSTDSAKVCEPASLDAVSDSKMSLPEAEQSNQLTDRSDTLPALKESDTEMNTPGMQTEADQCQNSEQSNDKNSFDSRKTIPDDTVDINKSNSESEITSPKSTSKELSDVLTDGVEPSSSSCTNDPSTLNTEAVEDIWENFYKTSSQNKNLPYPLCAMKSEIAYGIIMGDHDYCQQYKNEPVINEDVPSTSNLDLSLADDKMEIIEAPKPLADAQLEDSSVSPSQSAKKKQKSPKKKTNSNKNNSSSSSDSSSDSDSSSCSCGTNCSCSSSSSNSSSSSSSDSDSSSTEGRQKQERRRKRKEKRLAKPKEESIPEEVKEPVPEPEPEVQIPIEPEDPPIRESELETDETLTDEEFYDRQPQRIANQLLAEKRNQLMLLASVAPVNNGTSSPTQLPENSTPEQPTPTKQKQKSRRKDGRRKVAAKEKPLNTLEKVLNSTPQYSEGSSVSGLKHFKSSVEPKSTPPRISLPPSTDTPGSGSETDSTRASKRRRIPNKFYGYSSGEEEDKPSPAPPLKWRKQDLPTQSPKRPLHTLPPTPRIQLTVPKQVIRKQSNVPKPKSESSSDSDSDSGSESSPIPDRQAPAQQEAEKPDVYCYCRCPYDEVSEMIACDDGACEIEWFHFECVGISVPPRGQWYCPECRKRRGLPT